MAMLPSSTSSAIPTLKAKGFSYIVGSTYNAQLKTDADAIKYYEVILATKTEDGTANEVLKVKATDTALLNTLIASSNYGKLFYIETTGGYVSGVTQVAVVDGTSGKTWTTHTAGETAPYYHYHQYNDKVDTSYAVGYDNKTLKNAAYGNNILTLGAGNSFYVVTDTVVVGDLNVLTDKVIYVIGNEDGIASKVYVVDNDAAQGSTVTEKWAADTRNGTAYEINRTDNKIYVPTSASTLTIKQLCADYGATTVKATYTEGGTTVTKTVEITNTNDLSQVLSILAAKDGKITITNTYSESFTVVNAK